MKQLTILGSTGSIGRNALEIAEMFPRHFAIKALTAKANTDLLARQIEQFTPELAVVYDFNIKNHWTEDKNNFEDPRHFKSRLARELIREIWGLKKNWVRIASGNTSSN